MSAHYEPKIAIAVQKYYHPGQTFVNRHIRALFGGNNCIITERNYEAPDTVHQRPAFVISESMMNAHDLLRLPFYLIKNRRQFHAYRIPQGQLRQEMIAFLKAQKVDAILSEFGSQSMLVADIGREMNLPVFCYFRGRDASLWVQNKMRVEAYKTVFKELSGVFAVSQFLLDNLAGAGITHPNAHVVPSGTDIELFKPGKKKPNLVLAVGRFVDKKHPELTIKSFAEAYRSNPDARLEMIGGGPALKRCQKLADELGLQDAITLHGKKDSTFIAERLSHAAIFAQHSVTDKNGEAEGLPSSIQEAMAAGCAILSTRHAGIPELVEEGVTGYLCDELDATHYTQNLATMLNHTQTTSEMGKKARKIAEEKLDYRILYAKVEKAIQNAL